MAYAVTDPFIMLTMASLGGSGPRIFFHSSADALAAANTSGFITDGLNKGLRAGDYVLHLDTTGATGDTSLHRVLTVSTTAPGAVDLTDGTVVAAGANAD